MDVELGRDPRAAVAHVDTVTPVLARVETQQWEWTRGWTVAFARFVLEDPVHGEHNGAVLEGWVRDWLPDVLAAATALGPLAGEIALDVERATYRVQAYAGEMLADAGLPELSPLGGYDPPERESARPRSQAPRRKFGSAGSARHTEKTPSETGSFDYVGIVMAKSAEGDAVAAFMGRREGIEVREQPAFWDIRACDRLVIPYEQVSEVLGYAIDAYSIQHEISTHYGRMVATDDALMLFSDPTDAMEHLLS
jgi:propane monooxygenase coupling protein